MYAKASVSCAPASAVPLVTPAPTAVTLHPELDPKGPHEATARARCPGGTLVHAGGFALAPDKAPGVSDLGIGATTPSNDTPYRSGSWYVAAKNDALLTSNFFQASAACLNAQIHEGIFEIYPRPNSDEINEGSVTTRCVGGRPLAGSAQSWAKDGKKWKRWAYQGSFDTLTFTPEHDGFRVSYDAGHPGKDSVTVSTYCGWIRRFVAKLTQDDFDTACQRGLPDEKGVHAVPGKLATEWKCVGNLVTTPIPGNQGIFVCDYAHEGVAAMATYLSIDDPLSWVCYDEGEGVPASALTGRASGVELSAGHGLIQISGRVKLPRAVNLNRSKVAVAGLLHEATSSGELLKDGRGGEPLPVELSRQPVEPSQQPRQSGQQAAARSTRSATQAAVFRSESKPQITMRLRENKATRILRFDISARLGRVRRPRLCDSGPKATTHLTSRFVINPQKGQPIEVTASRTWRCRAGSLVTGPPALPLP